MSPLYLLKPTRSDEGQYDAILVRAENKTAALDLISFARAHYDPEPSIPFFWDEQGPISCEQIEPDCEMAEGEIVLASRVYE